MITASAPVPSSDRSDILDVLRGFAILGIFMANSAGFALYMFMDDAAKKALPSYAADDFLDQLMTAFIDGKFYSLFSLLFGIGFTIILDRNQKAGRNPLAIFYRRIFILTLLGLGHMFLLWPGDILFLYALIGMILPLFRNLTNKTLLILSVFLIFSPIVFDLAKVISDGAWNLSGPFEEMAIRIDEANGITDQNYRTFVVDNPTYQSILEWSRGGFFWRFEHIIGSNRIPKVLAMFLIGFVVGRKMIYSNLEGNKLLLAQVQKWGFLIGIPASIAFTYFMHDGIRLPKPLGLSDTLFYALSVIPLSLAYTTSICLLWLKPDWQSKLKILAPVGRMALTNYIMQTVAGILIYYGIGLALGGKTGPVLFLPIAVGVYVIQVVYSNIWFRYFRFGPLEWIWRMLTYGKTLDIRK
jgi:uncharacterized protein